MLNSHTSLAAVILGIALSAGCSTSSPNPSGPSGGNGQTTLTAGQIAGTWTLLFIEATGQTEQSAPAGASYELTLADGRASVKADCNACGGNFVVGSQTLSIGPVLACTRAACPTMNFENTFVAILAGDSAVRIDGNSLTLTSSRGRLGFRR